MEANEEAKGVRMGCGIGGEVWVVKKHSANATVNAT